MILKYEGDRVGWAACHLMYAFIMNYITTIMNGGAQCLSYYSQAFPVMNMSGLATVLRSRRELYIQHNWPGRDLLIC